MRWTRHERQAFAAGMWSGFRNVLAIGRYRDDAPRVPRHLGSPATDCLARYRDMDAFGADVPDEPRMADHGR
jgi:hypothetical protein